MSVFKTSHKKVSSLFSRVVHNLNALNQTKKSTKNETLSDEAILYDLIFVLGLGLDLIETSCKNYIRRKNQQFTGHRGPVGLYTCVNSGGWGFEPHSHQLFLSFDEWNVRRGQDDGDENWTFTRFHLIKTQ